MQPTIGRIVHYTLSEQDQQRITAQQNRPLPDGRSPLSNSAQAGDAFPAVIVRIWDATPGSPLCNLHVLLDGELTLWVTSRAEGAEPGTWAWPPRT
ncbi:hypothetical protein ACGFZP_05205 [Kitasatospora sp. NPDC048239]|uniref:hypothetical protein n=1 Tax=Kitasatospora sp. NPDC048239 TaxID=3364046 RepID=UPI0037107CCB